MGSRKALRFQLSMLNSWKYFSSVHAASEFVLDSSSSTPPPADSSACFRYFSASAEYFLMRYWKASWRWSFSLYNFSTCFLPSFLCLTSSSFLSLLSMSSCFLNRASSRTLRTSSTPAITRMTLPSRSWTFIVIRKSLTFWYCLVNLSGCGEPHGWQCFGFVHFLHRMSRHFCWFSW